MNTFLPHKSFVKSLACLDNLRLNKQKLETFQIINLLENKSDGWGTWRAHPAVLMWVGHTNLLKMYFNCSVNEWIKRGKNNNMEKYKVEGLSEVPFWFGKKKFHSAMRANLLRKDFEHYSQFGWEENNTDYMNTPYYWPVSKKLILQFPEDKRYKEAKLFSLINFK